MKFLLKTMQGVALLAACAATSASTLTPYLDSNIIYIKLEGRIEEGDPYRLMQVLNTSKAKNFKVWGLILKSPGGSVEAGLQLASIVRQNGLSTHVSANDICASACFYPFAAGVYRWADTNARVGVHSASENGRETDRATAATIRFSRVLATLDVPDAILGKIVKTPPEGCLNYKTLVLADRLAWQLQQHPQVQMSVSLVNAIKQITAGSYEGNPKFFTIQRNQDVLNYSATTASNNTPELFNTNCTIMPVVTFLKDHKADTLSEVSAIAEEFAELNSTPDRQFLLAAGTAGIEAATNEVVKHSNRMMLFYVYGAVILFCLITFRSWRATAVAILPLIMTSMLCEALMVWMGIGVKVATLPVIALGVGIGVDYALYLLSVQLQFQREGYSLGVAYKKAVASTGKVVALVGVTLATGVITWAWSPIKFQADMGILLTFMFLWNMLGALILIPALSYFFLNPKKAETA